MTNKRPRGTIPRLSAQGTWSQQEPGHLETLNLDDVVLAVTQHGVQPGRKFRRGKTPGQVGLAGKEGAQASHEAPHWYRHYLNHPAERGDLHWN